MHYYVAVCMLLVVCTGIEAGRHPRRTGKWRGQDVGSAWGWLREILALKSFLFKCILTLYCSTARSALQSADDATEAPSATNTSLAAKQSRQDIVIEMKTLENFINKLDSRLGSVESRMSSVEGKVATLGD